MVHLPPERDQQPGTTAALAASHPLSLAVIDALRAVGLVHESGPLAGHLKAREAERVVGIARNTLRRRIERGDFTLPQLEQVAAAVGTTSEQLIASARQAAA